MDDDLLTVLDLSRCSEEELASMEKHLVENPDNADVLEFVGTAYYRNQQFQKSMQIFTRLTDREPARAAGWYFLGNSLYQLEFRDRARAAWQKVIETDARGTFSRKVKEYLQAYADGPVGP